MDDKLCADILLFSGEARRLTERVKAAGELDELEILVLRRLYVALGDLVVELTKIPGIAE